MRLTRVVALAGGVGGAKMAVGLQAALPPGALTVVVNTGDEVDALIDGLNAVRRVFPFDGRE